MNKLSLTFLVLLFHYGSLPGQDTSVEEAIDEDVIRIIYRNRIF